MPKKIVLTGQDKQMKMRTGRAKGNFEFSAISSALPKWLFISVDDTLYIFVQYFFGLNGNKYFKKCLNDMQVFPVL